MPALRRALSAQRRPWTEPHILQLTAVARRIAALLFLLTFLILPSANVAALETKGLWVQIEERGWSSQYWPGQVIQNFNQFDPVVGHNVSDEVALQLDAMHAMGVNTITIELRTADQDGNFTFPTCDISPALGFQWPQPTATELGNLTPFFDLVYSKGMKIILVLVNTHMEQQPPTNSATWLGAILNVVKNHPALSMVVFNGNTRTIDTNGDGVPDACGTPAEAPLWLGPGSVPANYVSWAIGYAMSLGLPAAKLSAGTVVGDYFTDSEPPAGPDATDGHLWKPAGVIKSILDGLNIPNNQRAYALSFYEHRKCSTARNLPCTDADPPTWADQTLQDVYSVTGAASGARVVAYEMGNLTPVDPNWPTTSALANLVTVLAKYGAEGGSFWRWTSFTDSEDSDPTLATPIKLRGVSFTYTAAQKTLRARYKPSAHDLDADGSSDILWRDSSGDVAVWLMNGAVIAQSAGVGAAPPVWTIAGQRDFNGDGTADLLWRDTSGNVAIWFMNGASVIGSVGVGNANPGVWSVAGTGDFNGDGNGDVLWRDPSGNVAMWLMNGASVGQSCGVGNAPPNWTIAGVGDFNGDGNADILWHDNAGNVAIWLMNGCAVIQSSGVGNANPSLWSIVGTGDFNGDGKSDILWHDTAGNVAIWEMNGASVVQSAGVGNASPSVWSIAETGDLNSDGNSDILWHDTSGNVAVWEMNGAAILQSAGIGNASASVWTIQGLNAD